MKRKFMIAMWESMPEGDTAGRVQSAHDHVPCKKRGSGRLQERGKLSIAAKKRDKEPKLLEYIAKSLWGKGNQAPRLESSV